MERQREDLGDALMKPIGDPGLSDLAELGETIFDSFLEDGALKDVPIAGSFFKILSATRNIRDRLFLKKVFNFYLGAAEATPEEREEFCKKIEDDIKYKKKVGESLLLLIERHERFEKSFMLGRLLAIQIKGLISHEDFMRLASAVDRSTLEDLNALHESEGYEHSLSKAVSESLYKCGLMGMKLDVKRVSRKLLEMMPDAPREVVASYRLNRLGDLLIKHGFSEQPMEDEEDGEDDN